MILSTDEIREKFNEIYSGKDSECFYPAYQLGFKSEMIGGNLRLEVPVHDPDLLTAFNCGCVDGMISKNNRRVVEKTFKQPPSKKKTCQYTPNSPSEEFDTGF